VSSADLSGPAVFRVIQCESPCRGGVWVQDWFQGQSSFSGAIGKGRGPPFTAVSSPNGRSPMGIANAALFPPEYLDGLRAFPLFSAKHEFNYKIYAPANILYPFSHPFAENFPFVE
jgi:hypothetical protein